LRAGLYKALPFNAIRFILLSAAFQAGFRALPL
jgi:hypothetical protein